MTETTSAPAALQPDDTAADATYTALMDEGAAFWQTDKPTPYIGHAPQMDAGAPARAGFWLNEKVMHDASRTFGVIVGRAVRGEWWVELDLTGRGVERLLIDARELTLATPELEAVIAAERAQREAAMNESKARWEATTGRRWGAHDPTRLAQRTRTNQPADLSVRRCTTCQRVQPIDQFRFKTKAHDIRSYTCRECTNLARREERARKNPALFVNPGY